MEKHTHEPPPWHEHEDSYGDICDAKGNIVADCFAGQYSIDQILKIRKTIVKAVNLHDELAELVADCHTAFSGEEKSVKEEHTELIAQLDAMLEKLRGGQ
jgi:hypothetical protein